jgi:hypothetical protein
MTRNMLKAMGLVLLASMAVFADEEAEKTDPVTRPFEKRRSVTLVRPDSGRYVGVVKSVDANSVVLIDKDGEEKTIKTSELKPVSVYVAHRETLNLSYARSRFALGKIAYKLDLKTMGNREFRKAGLMKSGLRDDIKAFKAAFAETGGKPLMAAKASESEAKANRKRADAWYEYIKENINDEAHFTQTDHFWVYSTWNKSDTKGFHRALEKLYAALCKQFDIPKGQNIWAGKAAIFAFWKPEEYEKFCLNVMKSQTATKAAGFCGHRRGYVFVVLGPTRNKNWFYELLTHETTHGFVARYKTNRPVPTWVNEGLAETMSSTLVAKSNANHKLKLGHAGVLRGRSPLPVFKGVGLDPFDYGVAQSMVRYLIARDRKAFIKFFNYMKVGKPQKTDDGKTITKPLSGEEALQEAYGLSYRQLAAAWLKAVKKAED